MYDSRGNTIDNKTNTRCHLTVAGPRNELQPKKELQPTLAHYESWSVTSHNIFKLYEIVISCKQYPIIYR